MNLSLLIVDDHQVVRDGLVEMFQGSKLRVVGQARSGPEAVRMARKHRPKVVLLDVRMPEGDGLGSLEAIRKAAPDARVVMLSTFDNPTYVARSVAKGAADYLLKGTKRDELIKSILAAAKDEPRRNGHANHIRDVMASREHAEDVAPELTQRESQVLRHLALGLSNKEIANSLEISVETVKEHVQHVLRKLEVGDRTEAAVYAVRSGLV